jgi:hypothetical protein
MPESNTTYHNGFLDLLFVYGPILGGLGSLTLILSILWSGLWSSNSRDQQERNTTTITGLMIAVSLCTILESSMTTNHFWILLAVLLALQSDRQDSRATGAKKVQPKMGIAPSQRAAAA